MSGKKGRSGRKPYLKNVTEYFNKQFDLRSFSLVDKILSEAENGNRELLVYVFDRRLGKPKQSTDLNIEGGEQLGMSTMNILLDAMAQARVRLYSEAPGLIPEHIEGEVNDIIQEGTNATEQEEDVRTQE